MPSSRTAFHIGDLLSVVTGIVLSPRGARGVRALYEHLAGRPVSLEEVRIAGREYREHVLTLYPDLATFDASEVPHHEFAREWIERRVREFAEYFEVPPLPNDHPLHREAPVIAEPGYEVELYHWPPSAVPWIVKPGSIAPIGVHTMLVSPGTSAAAHGLAEVYVADVSNAPPEQTQRTPP